MATPFKRSDPARVGPPLSAVPPVEKACTAGSKPPPLAGEVRIESGIQIPVGRGTVPLGLPFDKMKPGDSFFVPGDVKPAVQAAYRYGAAQGLKFATRTVQQDGVAGVRIWLVGKAAK